MGPPPRLTGGTLQSGALCRKEALLSSRATRREMVQRCEKKTGSVILLSD